MAARIAFLCATLLLAAAGECAAPLTATHASNASLEPRAALPTPCPFMLTASPCRVGGYRAPTASWTHGQGAAAASAGALAAAGTGAAAPLAQPSASVATPIPSPALTLSLATSAIAHSIATSAIA